MINSACRLKSSSDGEEEENSGINQDEELVAALLCDDGIYSHGGDASEDEGNSDSDSLLAFLTFRENHPCLVIDDEKLA